MKSRCIIVRDDGGTASWTWLELIMELGDKTGSHFDDERPISWDLVASYEIGGAPVVSRLLYHFARTVVVSGNQVLAAVGEPLVDESELTDAIGGIATSEVQVIDNSP